jgi:hypothetical protein
LFSCPTLKISSFEGNFDCMNDMHLHWYDINLYMIFTWYIYTMFVTGFPTCMKLQGLINIMLDWMNSKNEVYWIIALCVFVFFYSWNTYQPWLLVFGLMIITCSSKQQLSFGSFFQLVRYCSMNFLFSFISCLLFVKGYLV